MQFVFSQSLQIFVFHKSLQFWEPKKVEAAKFDEYGGWGMIFGLFLDSQKISQKNMNELVRYRHAKLHAKFVMQIVVAQFRMFFLYSFQYSLLNIQSLGKNSWTE